MNKGYIPLLYKHVICFVLFVYLFVFCLLLLNQSNTLAQVQPLIH